jgi:predicted DNA-binding transcriptional regulator AlpA
MRGGITALMKASGDGVVVAAGSIAATSLASRSSRGRSVVSPFSGGLHCGDGPSGRRRGRVVIHGPPDRVVSSDTSLTPARQPTTNNPRTFGFGTWPGIGLRQAAEMRLRHEPSRTGSRQAGDPADALIGIGDIRALFKLGRTAAYELARRPDFPARVVISARCHRWWASEVDAFAAALRDHPASQQNRATRKTSTPQTPEPAETPLRITGRIRAARRKRTA